MKRRIKRITAILLCLIILGAASPFAINAFVRNYSSKYFLTPDESAALSGVDCILVLGCLVNADGTPSDMLEDRLLTGLELYKIGAAPKIIMSGDHGRTEYDEVNAMKKFAIDSLIPPEDVFMDHAGFSTYESMYRAKEIFGVEKMIIVTQNFHLYRAVYIARMFGIEAYGVSADIRSYKYMDYNQSREFLAIVKDFVFTIFKPKPTYLGEAIPVSGNGNLTND
ncbi:MAG: YdcF family protein [Clostridia bacterium]|nr:YdcF family protein [Clostridia bacterium]